VQIRVEELRRLLKVHVETSLIRRDQNSRFLYEEYALAGADCDPLPPKPAPNPVSRGGAPAAGQGVLLGFVAAPSVLPARAMVRQVTALAAPYQLYGSLLQEMRTTEFAAPGFRYAPLSEATAAITTNPAATAMLPGHELITAADLAPRALFTSLAFRVTPAFGWSIGTAFALETRSEDRLVYTGSVANLVARFNGFELASVTSVAKRLGRSLALGQRKTDPPGYEEPENDVPRPLTASRRADLTKGWRVMGTPDMSAADLRRRPSVRIGASVGTCSGWRSRRGAERGQNESRPASRRTWDESCWARTSRDRPRSA
jgi:hypothetical protein